MRTFGPALLPAKIFVVGKKESPTPAMAVFLIKSFLFMIKVTFKNDIDKITENLKIKRISYL